MIKYLYKILYKLKEKDSVSDGKYLFVYRCIKILINITYPILCRVNPCKCGIDDESDIIISLTTFPSRINKVWLTIETLMRQEKKPKKIILWLSEEQFPEKYENIPKRLMKLREKGLEIRFCEDIKSHKKYYYTMKLYPNNSVIIVDDDMFYPEDLVLNLMRASIENPGCICCNLAYKMIVDEYGHLLPYSQWERKFDELVGIDLCPIGCQGVLYPANSLHKSVFNKKDIRELCLNADDLWLKCMGILKKSRVAKVNKTTITFVDIMGTQNISLNRNNVGKNENDLQMKNILDKYSINLQV